MAASNDTQDAAAGDERGGFTFRSLAELGKHVLGHGERADEPDTGELQRAVIEAESRDELASSLSALASAKKTALSAAGVGGLEALAAVLDDAETQDAKTSVDEICIAFTDIVEFSDYTNEHGDEAALELLARHEAAVIPALVAQGTIVKRLGDGLMVVFADPAVGVNAILDAFDAINRDNEAHPDNQFHIRAGLTIGRPFQVGDDYIGTDVNLAARAADAADPDELLITDDAVAALNGDLTGVEFSKARGRRLKGFDKRIPLRSVQRSDDAA